MTMQRATSFTNRTTATVGFWSPNKASVSGFLQRQCACGTHTMGGGECAGCAKKKSGLQRKLTIGASNDPLEQEADRVADQVMAGPAPSHGNSLAPRIQRFSGHSAWQADQAPASVDRVLSSPGRPLEPSLRQDMEQRFGHDFSQVRVHAGAVADQSASEIHARAYTLGRDIVFAKGQLSPATDEGKKLLAHELTHVIQQGFDGHHASLQLKNGNPGAAGNLTDPTAEAQKKVFETVVEIENNWKTIAGAATPYAELKPWVADGNTVVALIRTHVTAGLNAIRANDAELIEAYKLATETDKITYDYIAWHTLAYANLLSVRSWVNELINAFNHDDRTFKGRAEAERITRELKRASDGLGADSQRSLALIRTNVPLVVRSGTPHEVSIMVTSPAIDPKVRTTFEQLTAAMQRLQANVQKGTEFVNQFLDEAYEEGLLQAGEALKEYALVRMQLGGKKKEKEEKFQKPQREEQPEPAPVLVPLHPPGDDDKKQRAAMRFQVQWNSRAKDSNKKGEFSEVAEASASVGVTTVQAVDALIATHAKVTPKSAKKAATPAVAKQTKWINSRPPAGIAQGGYSHSEDFEYNYPDARVDVENLRGHNLRR